MPLKINMDLDTALDSNHEPVYDEVKMEEYCISVGKTKDQLSEEEKQQFRIGLVNFHLDME